MLQPTKKDKQARQGKDKDEQLRFNRSIAKSLFSTPPLAEPC